MADNDNHYNVEMEAPVFNSEELVNTCLCTPTRSISDTSTADTINLDEISIDSNEQPSGDEPYDQMEEEDGEIDIIDEKFDCDPTLDYSFSANDVPSFSDNFWDYWCTDTPDSPSSIGYDCDDGANTAHCLSSIVSESECGSGSECDY